MSPIAGTIPAMFKTVTRHAVRVMIDLAKHEMSTREDIAARVGIAPKSLEALRAKRVPVGCWSASGDSSSVVDVPDESFQSRTTPASDPTARC